MALVTGGSRGIGAATVNPGDTDRRAPGIRYQPRSQRYYFDVGIGSVCLSGEDTGGKYCLIEASLAPGIGVPLHTHTRDFIHYDCTSMTTLNSGKLASLAKDLTKDYPRGPRDLLAGYIIECGRWIDDPIREYMEDYIAHFVPKHLQHHIDYFFDIYDAEEKSMVT